MSSTLKGKKILITREQHQAHTLADLISQRGGIPITVPLIKVNCLYEEQINLKERCYEWIFFTSVNGVRCFFEQMDQVDGLAHCRIAAVGSKTAEMIEDYGVKVDFIPSIYNAHTMVTEFLECFPDADHFLLVRGTLSRSILPEAFQQRNLQVHSVVVYETVPNYEVKPLLSNTLEHESIDILTFTSPSTVHTFTSLLEGTPLISDVQQLPAVSIGTTTEQAVKEQGFSTLVTPTTFTIEAMIEELEKYLNN